MLMVHCTVLRICVACRAVPCCTVFRNGSSRTHTEIDHVMKCQHFHRPCSDVAFLCFISCALTPSLFFSLSLSPSQMILTSLISVLFNSFSPPLPMLQPYRCTFHLLHGSFSFLMRMSCNDMET